MSSNMSPFSAKMSLAERERTVPAHSTSDNKQSLARGGRETYVTKPVLIRNCHKTQSLENLSSRNPVSLHRKASIRVSRYIT